MQSSLLERIDQKQQEGISTLVVCTRVAHFEFTATEQKLKTSISNWLSPLPTAQVHQTVSDHSEKGSGRWFLTSPAFESWLNKDGKQLWCWGIHEELF